MSRMWIYTPFITTTLTLMTALNAFGADVATPSFIRVVRDKDKTPLTLETATVTYAWEQNNTKIKLTAVAVVHIADKAYYDALNRQFDQFDSVCYELVAPKGTVPTPDRKSIIPHDMMGGFLGLASQMQEIDYSKPTFIHADMTPEELMAKMEEKGDDYLTVTLSAVAESMRHQNLKRKELREKGIEPETQQLSLEDILNPTKLKRLMAANFDQEIESALGPTAAAYLIDVRNQAAMKVVDAELQKGKKNIALFYGAAHFKHFHGEFKKRGFKAEAVSWEKAWDMSKKEEGGEFHTLLKILEQQLK